MVLHGIVLLALGRGLYLARHLPTLYYQPAHDNDNFQVLASECCDISYNDLDLIFTVDLPTQKHYERVSVEETEKQ